jgi:hypothetical protein
MDHIEGLNSILNLGCRDTRFTNFKCFDLYVLISKYEIIHTKELELYTCSISKSIYHFIDCFLYFQAVSQNRVSLLFQNTLNKAKKYVYAFK